MRVQKNNGSRMFLTELLFSILFFIIVVAVCVELFAQAHLNSVRAKELTEAVSAATNCAEYYLAWDGSSKSWEATFEGAKCTEDGFVNYLDDNFLSCEGTSAVYVVAGSFFNEGNWMQRANITVKSLDDEREIYNLEVKKAIFLED